MRVTLGLLVTCLAAAGCDLPRDGRGTLERVQGGVLRVGVAGEGPWARFEDGRPAGVEVALVEQAAARLQSRVEWVPGAQDDLLAALERAGLDLVVCGLTDDTPWASKVALTRPHATVRVLVAGPPAAAALEDLDGLEVEADDPLHAALVAARGGRPVPAGSGVAALRALPDWALDGTDLVPSGVVLREERHVLAAPPGENGWLVWLDRFLRDAQPTTPGLLRAEAP